MNPYNTESLPEDAQFVIEQILADDGYPQPSSETSLNGVTYIEIDPNMKQLAEAYRDGWNDALNAVKAAA